MYSFNTFEDLRMKVIASQVWADDSLGKTLGYPCRYRAIFLIEFFLFVEYVHNNFLFPFINYALNFCVVEL